MEGTSTARNEEFRIIEEESGEGHFMLKELHKCPLAEMCEFLEHCGEKYISCDRFLDLYRLGGF